MVNRAELSGTGFDRAQDTGGNRRRSVRSADTPTEYRLTSVGESPSAERGRRMRMYFITMSLRLACVASLAFVRDWWVVIPAIGAVVLPYFAVMVANAVGNREGEAPDAFTPQALTGRPVEPLPNDVLKAHGLIVVDAPAERRASGAANSSTEPTQDPADCETTP